MSRLDDQQRNETVRLVLAQKWPIGTVARQLGVHHSVVRRALRHVGVPIPKLHPRRSKLDPYVPFVHEQLEKYAYSGGRGRVFQRDAGKCSGAFGHRSERSDELVAHVVGC